MSRRRTPPVRHWQHIHWRSRGHWSKVHLRERGFFWTVCGRRPQFADVAMAVGDVTCAHCIRLARLRNLEGWQDG